MVIKAEATGVVIEISQRHLSCPPGVFYGCFYNHVHRLRLEKLSYVALFWIQVAVSQVERLPRGGFVSEAAKNYMITVLYNGHSKTAKNVRSGLVFM
jgi:hypothetical protein